MGWKKLVEDYFTFTRGNRIAILAILAVVISVFFLPDFLLSRNSGSKQTINDTAWINALKKIEQKEADNSPSYTKYNDDNSNNYQYDRASNNYFSKPKGELFYFDPNTLTAEGWKKLGLRDKTIGTIQNFLGKGGKFRKPEDVSKIYGLFPNEYERIAPYIKIQESEYPNSNTTYLNNKEQENLTAKNYTKTYTIFDINTAGVDELIALPGIGPTFSTRIVNFRNKLGGFYSVNQVAETFGLPDSTFQKIKQYLKVENTSVRKININSCTVEELKAHPYMKWSIANAIIAYRNQHGQFSKMEDIKKIMVVTDEVYQKIFPYLSL